MCISMCIYKVRCVDMRTLTRGCGPKCLYSPADSCRRVSIGSDSTAGNGAKKTAPAEWLAGLQETILQEIVLPAPFPAVLPALSAGKGADSDSTLEND